MTFDGLELNIKGRDAITCKVNLRGELIAKYVSPTFRYCPESAEHLSKIKYIDEAFKMSEIEPGRKEFLISRLEYWTKWVGITAGFSKLETMNKLTNIYFRYFF